MNFKEPKSEENSPETSSVSNVENAVGGTASQIFKDIDKIFKMCGSVHDGYFHAMLQDPVFRARYLSAYLPEKLVEVLDLSDPNKIEVLSTEFFDERVRKHIADMIFLIPTRKKDVSVALTLITEHKAQSGAAIDRKTVAQTLKYVALEVEEQLRKLPGDKTLYQPLVVLFYTGSDVNFEAPSWESSFPLLPELSQVEEIQKAQIRYTPLCVNLTRLFVEDKLNKEDFLYVMGASMALASLKKLSEHYSTLFSALGQIKDWTDEDSKRLKATINYVVSTTDRPMTREDMETLRLSSNSEEAREDMQTIWNLIKDDGRREGEIKGKIEGKIETIRTIALLRFQEVSERLASLLTELNDLALLEETSQFAMNAPSLADVEDYAGNLLQIKNEELELKKSA